MIRVGERALDVGTIDMILLCASGQRRTNRHDRKRWRRAFGVHAAVANDAMLIEDRGAAVRVLTEIVWLECALWITSEPKPVGVRDTFLTAIATVTNFFNRRLDTLLDTGRTSYGASFSQHPPRHSDGDVVDVIVDNGNPTVGVVGIRMSYAALKNLVLSGRLARLFDDGAVRIETNSSALMRVTVTISAYRMTALEVGALVHDLQEYAYPPSATARGNAIHAEVERLLRKRSTPPAIDFANAERSTLALLGKTLGIPMPAGLAKIADAYTAYENYVRKLI